MWQVVMAWPEALIMGKVDVDLSKIVIGGRVKWVDNYNYGI